MIFALSRPICTPPTFLFADGPALQVLSLCPSQPEADVCRHRRYTDCPRRRNAKPGGSGGVLGDRRVLAVPGPQASVLRLGSVFGGNVCVSL